MAFTHTRPSCQLTVSARTSRWRLSSLCVISRCRCRYQPSKFGDRKNFLSTVRVAVIVHIAMTYLAGRRQCPPVEAHPITSEQRGELWTCLAQRGQELFLTKGTDLGWSLNTCAQMHKCGYSGWMTSAHAGFTH